MTKYYIATEKLHREKSLCWSPEVDSLFEALLWIRKFDNSKIEAVRKIDENGKNVEVNIDIHLTLKDLNYYTSEDQLLLSGLGAQLLKL